jgi:glycosyltransferase involved in cell wall biosynthesis
MTDAPPLVVQVIPYYPPHVGGMEVVARTIAETLAESRDVTVLTTTCGAEGAARRERRGRLSVRRNRAMELAHTPLAPGMLLRLLNLPRRSVVHVHVAHAVTAELVWLASRLRGWPYIAQFHLDVDASGALGWLLPAYKRAVLGPILRSAAQVIVLSPEQADFVASTYRVDRQRLAVLPNGVGDEFFVERQRPTVVGAVGAQPLRLLYVGRLSPQKNVARLLEAMSLVREPIQLTVVGDGELRAELRSLAARLGLSNVTFAGARLGADLTRAYADAEAFVLPSDKEGMSLVALEAMAAALPIVATAVPGNTELLGDVALLAEPEPAALAAALDAVAADPRLGRSLGDRSRTAARAHDWDAVVRRVEDVYAEVLS